MRRGRCNGSTCDCDMTRATPQRRGQRDEGRHNEAAQRGRREGGEGNTTGAMHDKGGSSRDPHDVREGKRSANEKEREKKTNQVGAALRLAKGGPAHL